MKTNNIFTLVAFSCLFIQLLNPAAGISQNVGIGTSSPGQKLEVAGNLKIGDNLLVGGISNYKVYQNLASYSSTSTSLTGAIVITTTQLFDCMWSVTLKGHEYITGSFEYVITGYSTAANYMFRGSLERTVTCGTYNNILYIIIGEVGNTHNQPKLTITEFRQGKNNILETSAENWTVTVNTDISWIINQTAATKVNNDLWSKNSTDLYFNTGKVGVGLTSPLHPLHIKTSLSTTGSRAIYGINDYTGAGAQLYGIVGEVISNETTDPGAGVYGFHSGLTGSSAGVKGVSAGETGRGIFGYATDNSGLNYGVYGKTNSANGYAGYFVGGQSYFEGGVGIGDLSPNQKLSVTGGNTYLENTTAYHYINGTNTSSGQAGIQFQENGAARKSLYINNINDNFYIYDHPNARYDLTIEPSGDVGIGTQVPAEKLHVSLGDIFLENSSAYLKFKGTSSTGYTGLLLYDNTGTYERAVTYNNTSDKLEFYNAPDNRYDLAITGDGNIGMGTNSPATELEINGSSFQTLRIKSTTPDDVAIEFLRTNISPTDFLDWKIVNDNGTFKFLYSNNDFGSATDGFMFNYAGVNSAFLPVDDGNKNCGGSVNRWNAVYAVNGTIQTSDLREKENIADLDYGLDEVMQLHPVTYSWKQWPEQGTRIGLIAQEVEPILGEVVKKEQDIQKDEHGNVISTSDYTYGMSYDQLIPVLIKAIQEQQQVIIGLENRIEELETGGMPR